MLILAKAYLSVVNHVVNYLLSKVCSNMERQRLERHEKYQANGRALLCQNLYKTVFLSKLKVKSFVQVLT